MGPDAPPAAADGEDETIVTVGTSETTVGGLSGVALVCRLCAMVNRAYGYSRLSEHEVEGRLEMGDAGRAANRVLHIASRGGQVVGVCSSTLQAPWTPMGCGHWGLLVVDVDAQGSGVASALVRAAEQRLRAAGRSRVQIEYEYHGDRFSERLYRWCAPPRPRARAPRLSSGRPAPPPAPQVRGQLRLPLPLRPARRPAAVPSLPQVARRARAGRRPCRRTRRRARGRDSRCRALAGRRRHVACDRRDLGVAHRGAVLQAPSPGRRAPLGAAGTDGHDHGHGIMFMRRSRVAVACTG